MGRGMGRGRAAVGSQCGEDDDDDEEEEEDNDDDGDSFFLLIADHCLTTVTAVTCTLAPIRHFLCPEKAITKS